MNDTEVLLVFEELRACRVCLATDVALEALRSGHLGDTYTELTGIPVLPTDGLPQHLCSMCAALLEKSAAFKNKCRNTHDILQRVGTQLQPLNQPLGKLEMSMSLIRRLDKKYFKLPYITTDVETVSILEDTTYLNNYEIPVKQETQTKIEKEESEDDCVLVEDCKDDNIKLDVEVKQQSKKEEIFADVNITETENTSPISSNYKAVPKFKKLRIGSSMEHEKIKQYLIKSQEKASDIHKKLFCNYILDKYFYRTKESGGADEYDMFDTNADEKDTIIKIVDNSSDLCDINGHTVADIAELNKSMFVNYIREKYVNKKETKKKKKIVDLLRSRVGNLKFDKRFRTKEDLDEFAKTYNFDIIEMTMNEQILELQRSRKNALSYLQLTWKCEECFRGFTTETVYNRHMAVHDPISGSHVCEVCRHRFPTPKKIKRHMLTHKTKFVCQTCQLTFMSSSMAREHYNTHAGVSYECQYCGLKFRRYKSRVNHIGKHHGATQQCDICYESFTGVNGLAQHKSRSHRQTYQCASCDVHFDNAHAMLKHIGASPDGTCDPNVRACVKCGERFDGDEQLGEHVARLHARTREKPRKQPRKRKETTRWVKCCTCPHFEHGEDGGGHKVPNSEYNVPTGDSCPCSNDDGDECLCPTGLVRSCKLTEQGDPTDKVDVFMRNKWAHKGCCKERRLMRSYTMCEVCGSVFPNQAILRKHQLIHTGEKPFQCKECSKRFRLKALLQTHMYTHTGERPFKCSLCPKTFNSRENKLRHKLVHTKERRHRCEVCDKMFQTSSSLKLHVRTVHMKIPQPPRVRNRKRKCE